MPRFGTKFLLLSTAVIAVWLSTFTDFPGSAELRVLIMHTTLISSGVAALTLEGKWRAFWGGFCGAMLAMAMRLYFSIFELNSLWLEQLARESARYISNTAGGRAKIASCIYLSGQAAVILAMAFVTGLVCASVYTACKRTNEH